jgi:hypothetical protein
VIEQFLNAWIGPVLVAGVLLSGLLAFAVIAASVGLLVHADGDPARLMDFSWRMNAYADRLEFTATQARARGLVCARWQLLHVNCHFRDPRELSLLDRGRAWVWHRWLKPAVALVVFAAAWKLTHP